MTLNGITNGVDLPLEMKEHCITKLNDTHNIILGGKFLSATKTYIFNSNFEVTDGPSLPGDGRYQHACAHIRHKNGSMYVIVVGGHLNDDPKNPTALRTSDILDVNNKNTPMNWFTGKWYRYIALEVPCLILAFYYILPYLIITLILSCFISNSISQNVLSSQLFHPHPHR